MENAPNYYAILPAGVRYDNRLKAAEKLLYAELTALAQRNGYAWASNDYFAKLYAVSKETVSRWLADLEQFGYIKRSMDPDAEFSRRIVVFEPMKDQGVLTKKSSPLDEKIKPPLDQKIKHNNTRSNIKKEQGRGDNSPHPPSAISLPLNDGTYYPVSQEMADRWSALYPAVEIMQELRKMAGWLEGNPQRRKTKRGIVRFIVGWLSREQDRGRKGEGGPSGTTASTSAFKGERI